MKTNLTKTAPQRPASALTAVFIGVFLVMLVLSCLTPFGHDDYSYSFSFADNTRIHSLSQIIPSMVVHRQILNGRVILHAFVQFFLMLPKLVFNVFNAANAVLLTLLVSRFLHTTGRKKLLSVVIFLISLWAFSPAFGENYLWLDGAINYSWTLTLGTLFLWPYAAAYLELPRRETAAEAVLRMLLAFVMGSCSENISLVFLFLAVCLTVLVRIREKSVSPLFFIWIVFAVLGYVFLMTAPATAGRGSELNISAIANNLAGIITATKSSLLWLYLIYAGLLCFVILRHGKKQVIILSLLFVFGGLASLSCFVFAAYFIPRHFCCTEFLTVFAVVLLADEALSLGETTAVSVLGAGLAVFFLFQFSLGTIDIVVSHHKAAVREATILAARDAGEDSVTVENYGPATRYALRFQLSPDDREAWPNNSVASYYDMYAVYGSTPEENAPD